MKAFDSFFLASKGLIDAGYISPVVPIRINNSAFIASEKEFVLAGSGMGSPKKTKSGFNMEPQFRHVGGKFERAISLTG